MYIILKSTREDGTEEFIVYNKQKHIELARFDTYDEAFKDMLSR